MILKLRPEKYSLERPEAGRTCRQDGLGGFREVSSGETLGSKIIPELGESSAARRVILAPELVDILERLLEVVDKVVDA